MSPMRVVGWGASIVGGFLIMSALVAPLAVWLAAQSPRGTPTVVLAEVGLGWFTFIARETVTLLLGLASVVAGIAFLRRRPWSRPTLQFLAGALTLLFFWGLATSGVSFFAQPHSALEISAGILGVASSLLVCAGLLRFIMFLGQPSVRQHLGEAR